MSNGWIGVDLDGTLGGPAGKNNRRELALEERGAVHLLNRAGKYLVRSYYTYLGKRFDGCLAGSWELEAAEDAKHILDSCSASIFHGGEPRRAKKTHWSQEIA